LLLLLFSEEEVVVGGEEGKGGEGEGEKKGVVVVVVSKKHLGTAGSAPAPRARNRRTYRNSPSTINRSRHVENKTAGHATFKNELRLA
jgi:hypothetical protein